MPAYDIRVVSFDLDNTLWNTSATIDAANDALAQHLNEQLLRQSNITTRTDIRVEKVMGTLFQANMIKYSPLEAENAKSPVLLTQLRKDAIHKVVSEYTQDTMNNTNTENTTIIESIVDHAFDVWMKARHDAISQQLTPSTTYVMECIQSMAIKSSSTTTTGTKNPSTKILIGAITDGNSNPKLVPELSKVFDFYINAEMVGVGKPHKRIYIQAVKDVFQKYPMVFDDMIATATMMNDEISDDQIEELIGPWWIHIGDDFIKDIVASNSLKMRNIWTRELCSPRKDEAPQIVQQQEKLSQRTVDELMQVVNEKKVVEMSIGADTYLADTVSNEFATAVVDELRDVVNILRKWQNDALVLSTTLRQNNMDSSNIIDDNSTIEEETMSNTPSPVSSETKFCIECRTKLPIVARFCSTCGSAQ